MAGVLTFSFTDGIGLIPGGYVDITFTSNVDDIFKTPFRNWAEISADDGNDEDSVPDTNTGSDSTLPNDAYTPITALSGAATDIATGDGTAPTSGDDNDDATVQAIVYDLALVNVVNTPSVDGVGQDISWTIRVQNQGTLDSGAFTVTDTLPANTSFSGAVSYTVGGTGQTVGTIGTLDVSVASGVATITQSNPIGLVPGGYIDITFTTTVTSMTTLPLRNWAEISADSGADDDSLPDTDTGSGSTLPNDPYVSIISLADAAIDIVPGDGTGTDTGDDNDDAQVTGVTYDLALRKTLVSVDRGLATFEIEVFNQGIGTVGGFDVVDTIDGADWYPFNTTLNPGGPAGPSSGTVGGTTYASPASMPTVTWNATNPLAPVAAVTGPLAPGESVTIPVVLVIDTTVTPRPASVMNVAEISALRNPGGAAVADTDSTPDTNATNDAGGAVGTASDDSIDGNGSGAPGDTSGATDEDDADPALVPLYDLALAKVRSASTPRLVSAVPAPVLVSYDVTVTNQGANDVFTVQVTDTAPAGLAFDSVTGAGGTAPTFTIPTIPANDSVTFTVTYRVTDFSSATMTNVAEISAFDVDDVTTNALPVWAQDLDSTPDTDPGNDAGGAPDSAADTQTTDDPNPTASSIAGDGTGATGGSSALTDEDDADPAVIELPYDLALRKRIDPSDPQAIDGADDQDRITFYLEVLNQGRDVSEIDVIDYLGAGTGWMFDIADNPGGTAVAGTYAAPAVLPTYTWDATDPAKPVATITGGLQGGESVRIPIVLTVNAADLPAGGLANVAEIAEFRDGDGVALVDRDSTPDADAANDVMIDDVIDNSPSSPVGADEDDSDIAYLKWWDLALIKTSADYVLDATAAAPLATFTITLKNQGVEPATNVTVLDTAPAGTVIDSMSLVDSGSGTCSAAIGECVIDTLAPGATEDIAVVLRISDKTVGSYENTAEITGLQGMLDLGAGPVAVDVSDIDSTPDADVANDVLFEDPTNPDDPRNSHNQIDYTTGTPNGSINEPNPTDEDDHDTQVVVFPLAVGDYVWYDLDHDGIQDTTERPVTGALVKLMMDDGTGTFVDAVDADGNNVNSNATLTDADGWYLFDNLLPGTYQLVFEHKQPGYLWTVADTPGDDAADSDASDAAETASTSATAPFDLAIGQPNIAPVTVTDVDDLGPIDATHIDRTRDAGIWMPVAVGDVVWYDVNGDGVQGDPTAEPGVGEVSVTLYDADGTPATTAAGSPATTTTGTDGSWAIDNLLPGDYYAVFGNLPAGWNPTTQGDGSSPTEDSNANSSGVTPVFTLATSGGDMVASDPADALVASMIDPTIDMGLFKPVSVGDLVWYDADHDGTQDPTESGLAGVVVTLTDTNGDAVVDSSGAPVAPAATDSDGRYSFTNLVPGDYRVTFTLPSGFLWTSADTPGDDSLDSDVVPSPTSDDATLTTEPITLDPFAAVPLDSDPDGFDLTNPTIDAGVWFPFAIGDYVWFDVDRDGAQGPTEAPVVGALAHLSMDDGTGTFVDALDADGNPVSDATTDADGFYFFDNLLAGTYRVEFTHNQVGWFWTTMNSATATDATDSDATYLTDADPTAATGDIMLGITVTGGVLDAPTGNVRADTDPATKAFYVDPTNDAGIWMPVAVGDYVWYDTDRDGTQDGTEAPVEGVTVELLNPDLSPALDADGVVVAETLTDAQGFYLFDRLLPGDYVIRFSGWPAGWAPTTQGTDPAGDAADSNPDDTGVTSVFTLSAAPVDNMVANGDAAVDAGFIDPTIDMGIFKAASLGDLVWYDANRDGVYDPTGESGLAGVTVELLMKNASGTFVAAVDADGASIDAVVTDSDGRYSFTNLVGGDYKVLFHLPAGYSWTRATPKQLKANSLTHKTRKTVTPGAGTRPTIQGVGAIHSTVSRPNSGRRLRVSAPLPGGGVAPGTTPGR